MAERHEPVESVRVKADRYFADQCRRLGPIESVAAPARQGRKAAPSTVLAFDRLAAFEPAKRRRSG